jgi:hypothetical protein
MTQQLSFHAEKPLLATHPVNGGDALIFSIAPPPPKWWWRAMRMRAGANDALVRPWDQEQASRLAVVCPRLADVTAVIDAVDTCVAQANADYEGELDLQRASAAQLKTDKAAHDQYLDDVRRAIDERYGADGDATHGVATDTVGSGTSTDERRMSPVASYAR